MNAMKKTIAILATTAICLSGCASLPVTEPTIPDDLPANISTPTSSDGNQEMQVNDLAAKLSEIESAWYVATGATLGTWCVDEDTESTDSVRYYGNFDGYDIFFRPNGDDAVTQLLVEDVEFDHRTGFEIYAYRSGEFITLQELYAQGGLTKMNLLSLRVAHGRFEGSSDSVISKFDGLQNVENAELLMKQAFLAVYDKNGEYSLRDLTVTFYGTYGEAHVGFINGILTYTQAFTSESVGGVIFRYNTGQKIQVCHNGELMSLTEAYNRGLLTQEDLMTIHGKFAPKDSSYATE